jgi:poly(A) polymerase
LLKGVTPERVADELRLMLTPPSRTKAWPLLWSFGLLQVIFRFLSPPAPSDLNPVRSVFARLAPGERISFGLALAGGGLCVRMQAGTGGDVRPFLSKSAVHDLARALDRALKLSNEEHDQIEQTLVELGPLLADGRPRVATLKRFLAHPCSIHARKLLDALAAADLHVGRIKQLQDRMMELDKGDVAPPPWVSGDDLTNAGLEPGPIFKRILEAIYDAQLEGELPDKPAALARALELARDLAAG